MAGRTMVMDHPLIAHKISYIRQESVGTKEFREVIGEIAQLMCYEATRDLKTKDVQIKTPIAEMTGKVLAGKKLAIVPILRAGLGMVDGMLSMIPAAKVGHIGLYRDPETLEPVEYYCKLPADCGEREVFVVDPMLATGGSSVAAIRMLKEKGGEKYIDLEPQPSLDGNINMWIHDPDGNRMEVQQYTEISAQKTGKLRG